MNTALKALAGWALYDLANTIFSAVVLTAYFPLYLTELTGANWYLGLATTCSMVLAGLFVPFVGALSDRTGKAKAYLIRTTLITIVCFALLSFFRNKWLLIGTFVIAAFFFHLSLVFYNSLLPVVADEKNQGFASGLGTGLGYLGVVLALPLAYAVETHWGRHHVFWTGALLFLVFSFPLFFWVPERKVGNVQSFRWSLWLDELLRVRKTLSKLPEQPALLLFLGGNFFVLDALNSTIFWVAVYVREVFHPGQAGIITFLLILNLSAFAAGIVCGFLTDKVGSSKMILWAAGSLALTLLILSWIKSFRIFSILCFIGGSFAISGIWTSGRKVLIDLAPEDEIGEYFGLYGLTTKISIIASFAFSIVADTTSFQNALRVLVFPAAVGFFALLASRRAR